MKLKDKNKILKKDKENKSKNIVQNYVVLILLFIVCIVVVLYISELYKIQKEEEMKIPVIKDTLSEIYQEDLGHYIVDNPSSIVYMCVADSNNCRNFERDFKKFLKKNDMYSDQIIYLNLTDVDTDNFVNNFNSLYHYKNKLNNSYPAFIVFDDGRVVNILQSKDNNQLTISKVKQFLELYQVDE